jgi:hypothetical protein
MDVATSIIYQGYVQDVANGSYETLFTATTEVAVNDITFINKSGSAATIDLQLWPLGVSGNATQLISSVSVAATDDFEYVGVINLKSTDVLKVKADTNWAIDVILSAVE